MTYNTYDSVTNVVLERDPGGVVNAGCGNVTIPAWTAPYTGPPNVKRSYRESEVNEYVYDPSKGRSFKSAREGGKIVMSAYTKGVDKTSYHMSSIDRRFTHASYSSTGKCGPTGACAVYGPNATAAYWTENNHYGSLSGLTVRGDNTLDDYRAQVPDLVSSTQQSAFASALNAYDLLTEIGEMRETLTYLFSKVEGTAVLMNKFKEKDPIAYQKGRRSTAKTLLRSGDASLRRLGGRWMEYRYALMPLFYSFADINKLFKEHAVKYHSERSKEVIQLKEFSYEGPDECLYTSCSGTIEVRSLTKASYEIGSLQRLASTIGFNPVRTAWELVPLSFVVDWALNVGDAISSMTSIDYSSQRLGCTTIRANVREDVFHHKLVNDVVSWDWGHNPCGFRPTPWYRAHTQLYNNLVKSTEVNSYVRTLWSRPDANLVVNPYLNWKRTIDGLVLSYQPVKKILRSLK